MMTSNSWIWTWLSLLLIPVFACSQPNISRKSFELNAYIADPCFETAAISFQVLDLQIDSIIYQHNAEMALPPASTQKLLTTAAALVLLGPEFQFETQIGIMGSIHGDALEGDLVLKGFGDPSLGSSHFNSDGFALVFPAIAEMLAKAGIKYITGNITGDASYYSPDQIPKSWPYLHLGNYYGAFCGGLNFFDNLHYLRFRQRPAPGDQITDLTIEPEVPGLSIQSFIKSGPRGSGDEAYIMGAPFQNNRYVQGTIPPGNTVFTIKGSLPDPALFLTYHLKLYLESEGFLIGGQYQSEYLVESRFDHLIGSLHSPKMNEIVRVTNQKSVNLFAEGLGLRCSKDFPIESEDWLLDFWKDQGIIMEGCHFYDFAGLAPDNAVNAKSMVNALRFLFKHKEVWQAFKESLSVAGENGTLQGMFRSSPAKGQILGKSGLINGVRSYAGYMKSRSGRWYAFDLMTHNPVCDSGVVRNKLRSWMEDLYLSLP